MPHKRNIKKQVFAIAMTLFFVLSAQSFCQSPDSRLTFTVRDSNGATLPGAAATVINMNNRVEAKTPADAQGNCLFSNLPPGTYKLTVEATGFETCIMNVNIGVSDLKIIDVVMKATELRIYYGDRFVPEVKPKKKDSQWIMIVGESPVTWLPSISNDAMNLIDTLGMVTPPMDNLVYPNTQMLGGTMAPDVSILRDEVYINKVRRNSGIQMPSRINPEVVDELKVILSPADAEYGWGVGWIYLSTKSGGNQFRGSVVYSLQNDALNSHNWNHNSFSNNWSNQHNYTATFSGPIIRRRLFFFANWDQTIGNNRSDVTPIVLTTCARKGIMASLFLPAITM
jgi:hypothetical protein